MVGLSNILLLVLKDLWKSRMINSAEVCSGLINLQANQKWQKKENLHVKFYMQIVIMCVYSVYLSLHDSLPAG